MSRYIEIDFTLSDRAREALLRYMAGISSYTPIPSVLRGRKKGERTDRWLVGFYDQELVKQPNYPGYLVQVSGLEVFILSEDLPEQLNNKMLDWSEKGFDVIPRSRAGDS